MSDFIVLNKNLQSDMY